MVNENLQALYSRIRLMDVNAPYVWRLAVTSGEYEALESAVVAQGIEALLRPEWSRRCIVYLAEWYKRHYSGTGSHPGVDLSSEDLARIWGASGFADRFLYALENGNRSWRYSIYVLGGLAVRFELNKSDSRTLKELCRLYHGEEDSLDNLDEADRAVAFRQSLRRQESLYGYLKAILEGKFPFAEEDKKDSASPIRQFIDRVIRINQEVLRSKFWLEWRIVAPGDSQNIQRRLRLHLKPEEVGVGRPQYLHLERVEAWGIANPEGQRRLDFFVRFWKGAQLVSETEKPVITYNNTGNRENGFLAWGVQSFVSVPEVPAVPFDTVEIAVAGDDGIKRTAEKLPVEAWLQVFRVNAYSDEWSSAPYAQHESALFCSTACRMLDIGENEVLLHRLLVCRRQEPRACLWRHIHACIRFTDDLGKEHTLFNRQGYDLITARLHEEVLRYSSAGEVACRQWDEELEDYTEETCPLLLGKEDLVVRHFATRNDLQDDKCELISEPEKIEFKERGGYVEWNEESQPHQGFLQLRITVKGRQNLFAAYYFPYKIERDFQQGQIRIGDEVYQDSIPLDGVPLEPVVTFAKGDEVAKVRLEVWRPVLHKEMIRGGRVARYVQPGQRVALPYILKEAVEIQDFNESGYKRYECRDLSGLYQLPDFSHEGNSWLVAMRHSLSVTATTLEACAPSWLDVCLSVPLDTQDTTAVFCHWNYFKEVKPQACPVPERCLPNEIVFFNVKDSPGICVYPYVLGEYRVWGYPRMKIEAVTCFEVAVEYGLYFFELLPLRNIKDPVTGLYEPLLARRNGQLTEQDVKALKRFAEEFGFDWTDKNIILA